MKHIRNATACNKLGKHKLTSVTPAVTPHINSPKYLQGWLAKSHPLGVGLERFTTGFIYKGFVTCNNRANAHSTRPPSVTCNAYPWNPLFERPTDQGLAPGLSSGNPHPWAS